MTITHSQERNFKCDQCDKLFKHQSNLLTHKKSHNGFKVKCLVCEKWFTTRGNLKKHLKTHVETQEELDKLWNDNYVTELSVKFSRRAEPNPVKVEVFKMGDDYTMITETSEREE